MAKVLVAYATKYGATAEIAEAVGEVLRESDGIVVDVLNVEQVADVNAYDAVVLGSAVYAGNWRGEAMEFLAARETELTQRPLWLFSSGPTGDGDPVELLSGWTLPKQAQAVAGRIMPRDIAVFHGNIDMEKLNLGERLIVKTVRGKTGDYRDWVMIREWATEIVRELKTTIAI